MIKKKLCFFVFLLAAWGCFGENTMTSNTSSSEGSVKSDCDKPEKQKIEEKITLDPDSQKDEGCTIPKDELDLKTNN